MDFNETAEYVRRTLNGDSAAFSQLYKGMNKRIYFICMHFLKNECDANDAVQETYLTAYKNLHQLSDIEKFNGWLERIAINKCKDFLKKNTPIPMDDEELKGNYSEEKELILPEEYIVNAEKRKIVMNIMHDRLSDLQYRTVILYYFNSLTVRETAEVMECSEGAVKNRLSIARAKIKVGVEQYMKDNDDKLYSFTGIPFLTLLLSEEVKNMIVPDLSNAIMNEIELLSLEDSIVATGKTIETTGKVWINMIKAKIIAGAAAATVAVGGVTATVVHFGNSDNRKDNGSAFVSSQMQNKQTTQAQTNDTSVFKENAKKEESTSETEVTIVFTTPKSTQTEITKKTETDLQSAIVEVPIPVVNVETKVGEQTATVVKTDATITTVTTTDTTLHADLSKYEDALLELTTYQEKFFELRKLREENKKEPNYDWTTYSDESLFVDVESKLSKNTSYYERYSRIEPDLLESNYGYADLPDVPDDYYVGAVAQWSAVYREYDALLNDLYSDIETQIPTESFIALQKSEIQWIEDVDYFIDAMDSYNVEAEEFRAESIKFRCLLLMLYL